LFSVTFPDYLGKSFVFIDIPGSPRSFPDLSFVFNDILGSLVHFLKLPMPTGGKWSGERDRKVKAVARQGDGPQLQSE
jgi:hypothetical protein